MALDVLSPSEEALGERMLGTLIDSTLIFEIDGAFFDPAASKNVAWLAHRILPTLAIQPSANVSYLGRGQSRGNGQGQGWSDVIIVRNRAELFSH